MTRALSNRSSIELHFARIYARRVYGIAPEQVVGTAGGTKYSKDGRPSLTKEPLSLPRSMTRRKDGWTVISILEAPVSVRAVASTR
jgi:hypothetical protein